MKYIMCISFDTTNTLNKTTIRLGSSDKYTQKVDKNHKKCYKAVLVYDELQEKPLLYLKTIIKSPLSFPIFGTFI